MVSARWNRDQALSWLCVLAAIGLWTCAPQPGPLGPAAGPTAPTARPTVVASVAPSATASPATGPGAHRFAVAAESGAAAKTAMQVLERGGSAVDAAIAAVLVSGVVQPVSSGLGGGGFALCWTAKTQRVAFLDFRETAPGGIRPKVYEARPLADSSRGRWVGVPGEVAGMAELHQRWGVLPLGELHRPAARIAKEGFAITPHMHRALRWNRAWVTRSRAYGAIFAPLGKLTSRGDEVKNHALATTLERLASEGPSAFYGGAIGRDVVATARAAGSRIVLRDLKRYEVEQRAPVSVRWGEHQVYTAPPPSGGGLMVAQTLTMHGKDELTSLGYGSGAYLHVLAETFRGAVADRIRAIGDPMFIKTDVAQLTSVERMRSRRAGITLDKTRPVASLPFTDAGTSQIVTVDAEGNVALVASSVHGMFGARLVTDGGFVLNDQLGAFTKKQLERQYRAGRQPNVARAGARPASSMTPTLVVRSGAPVLALGASGGTRIPASVTQALLARLVFGRSALQSVSDGRIQTPALGGLRIEAEASADLVADLRARGEAVENRLPDYSAVQLVAIGERDGARWLEAASDPRKGGLAIVR
ncbi:MAG: gamma-glutamyltransferase [Deltaproteobacteria bacterium]|nr:gamma-glutamyltransferase [Deltaproteobacteria bacterium]